MLAVLTKTLKDPTAKDILCQYQHNGDSQQIYVKLNSKARKSAKATLAKMRLVEFLTTGNLITPGKVPIMDSFYIGVLSCVSLKKLLFLKKIEVHSTRISNHPYGVSIGPSSLSMVHEREREQARCGFGGGASLARNTAGGLTPEIETFAPPPNRLPNQKEQVHRFKILF